MTPIERAARALALSDSGVDCWDALDPAMQAKLIESARAVLEAVREPSEAMCYQGESAATVGIGRPVDEEAVPRVWRNMIDAALSE